MPATSKKQQHFMGMVHAFKKGKLKNAPDSVKKAAKSITDEDAVDFASSTSIKESFKQFLQRDIQGDTE